MHGNVDLLVIKIKPKKKSDNQDHWENYQKPSI